MHSDVKAAHPSSATAEKVVGDGLPGQVAKVVSFFYISGIYPKLTKKYSSTNILKINQGRNDINH